MTVSYVLPIRWDSDEALAELTAYLTPLARIAEVVVVDGSPPAIFERHHRAWAGLCVHVAPDPDLRFAYGKVNGVHTGMRRAAHEAVVIADDDVRYDSGALARIENLLGSFDLVRPQNYFAPAPWHALWDTARTLLNRAFGQDWPGTLGVRRSVFRRIGGYDGDTLFENLELVRTVRAAGGRVAGRRDVYVRRVPPTARHFWSQRVRQAYDEFARPWLLGAWLGVVPGIVAAAAAWPPALAGVGAAAVGLAEIGRRRAGGRRFFPAAACLFAPAWLLERGVCAWLAVASRLRYGGVRYGTGVIRRAATPNRALRGRFSLARRSG